MPTTKFEKLSAEKMASLTQSALVEFGTYPFHQASFNRIIKNSGLSKGAVYYYFQSKEDLFRTIIEKVWQELPDKTLPGGLSPEPQQFWNDVRRYVSHGVNLLHENPDLGRFLLQFFADWSKQSEGHTSSNYHVLLEDWILDLLVTGQERNAIRRDLDLKLALRLIWSTTQTMMDWFLAFPSEKRSEEYQNIVKSLTSLYARVLMPGA